MHYTSGGQKWLGSEICKHKLFFVCEKIIVYNKTVCSETRISNYLINRVEDDFDEGGIFQNFNRANFAFV